MNRKATMILIGAIVAILPAVAIADVMITGQIGIVGTQNSTVFQLVRGPNFEQTDGYIGWNSYSSGSFLGDLHLNPTTNQTVLAVNVMEITFSSGTPAGLFWLNLTGSSSDTFPEGAYLYVSTSLMSLSDFAAPYSPDSPGVGIIPLILQLPMGAQTSTGPINVDSSTILYIGFYLPGVGPSSVSAEITGSGAYLSS